MAHAQERHVRALKNVSADIAHDLKTPLQRVGVHLSELETATGLQGDAAELVHKAQKEVMGMGEVFNALLQLAQVEAGSPKARFVGVDLAEVCRTVVEVFAPMADETGKALTLKIPAQAPIVQGDRMLLAQMLSNLIENALRHTSDESAVEVELRDVDDAIELSVSDNGPGIPQAAHDKVIQRLYRLDRSRNTPGHGIGLSLVKAVADLHEAELVLRDNAPGLRVTVRF